MAFWARPGRPPRGQARVVYAEDEGEGGHQDRAAPCPGGLQRGWVAVRPGSSSARANSMIRMAFLAARPMV